MNGKTVWIRDERRVYDPDFGDDIPIGQARKVDSPYEVFGRNFNKRIDGNYTIYIPGMAKRIYHSKAAVTSYLRKQIRSGSLRGLDLDDTSISVCFGARDGVTGEFRNIFCGYVSGMHWLCGIREPAWWEIER